MFGKRRGAGQVIPPNRQPVPVVHIDWDGDGYPPLDLLPPMPPTAPPAGSCRCDPSCCCRKEAND